MQLSWEAVVVDAHDPTACAEWWAETLGGTVVVHEPNGVEVRPADGRGPSLFFAPGAPAKTGKNRLHLDLSADDHAAAVEALLARGAERVDVGQGTDPGFVVLCDPEGNEFCLLEPHAP